ncbi:MAG: hypothetical protein EHM35_00550 [Planctomycetaceae bacterium]|nr:MAG: hypothetical protein EHM35_00550 [Planctomycetaceae bacterium]
MGYSGYAELRALSPETYLAWEQFDTPFDGYTPNVVRDLASEQYTKGLRYGQDATMIHIAVNGTWSTETKTGGCLSSCEGIGYHACTKDLLRGFLDSGTPITVHRWNGSEVTHSLIK